LTDVVCYEKPFQRACDNRLLIRDLPEVSDLESILVRMREQEKEYDWLGVTDSYKKVLEILPEKDCLKKGDIWEQMGYAHYRAAMQAGNHQEFTDRMHQATEDYGKAKEAYEDSKGLEETARALRCNAMATLIGHWVEVGVLEKKRLLDECWKLTKESLKAFEEARELEEYGRTYNQLSSSAIFIFTRESDFKSRENVMREAVESGEKAIQFLSDCDNPSELARAYARAVVCLGVFGYYFQDVDEREAYRLKGLGYWAKAKKLSEEVAMTEFLYPVFGGQPFFGLEGTDEAFANYEKALEYGKKTKDKFIMGCAADWLTYHTAWKSVATEDPDEKIHLGEKVLKSAEEAESQFSIISFVSPRDDLAWLGGVEVEHRSFLASLETDTKKRRDLFEKALQAAASTQKRGEESGYPEIMMYIHSGRGFLRQQLAKFETDPAAKKRLLEEALTHNNESIRVTEELEPFLYWNRGIMRNQLCSIKYELAELTKEKENKKALLQEAVVSKEKAIELCIKELTFLERKESGTSLFATVGNLRYEYGNMLIHLCELTSDKELLRKATKVYEDAIETAQRLNLVASVAQTYWKMAQVYDKLGEHVSAYQSFESARANYAFASEKIPQLRDFYRDQAVYMHAWSQIEKARQHHEKQEYGLAEEHFEKASKLHEQLKKWNYLAPNYAAWARTDHAEELSRTENSEEALEAFKNAAGLFEETRKSLQNQLDGIEDFEERQMAKDVLKATELRHQYCMARIAVEEAKIFDKKGDHYSSSEKYTSAAETLAKIAEAVESERDKREFNLITTLSQAWAKMTLAEAEESPAPYLEASQLFEKAKELSSNEKTRTLALGHSRFCRALEAGMRFADTGDATLHATAIQHLESASKYYVKAGYQSASEYAKATELLLDAYAHIDNAKKEADPEKKAKLFAIAEKVLQTSAGYFMKAEHPEKREQVLRLLEKVKEDRELALSLCEVLHTPSIVSTTAAFTNPTPNQENSVGLERFESANIQANIITHQKRLKVGENLDLEIELINAGKGPAVLIKITQLIPSGFELAEKPEVYRVEDSYLNRKGKRIDSLKTEEVKLTLRPKIQGEFILKPTVLYLDENGKYKSHEPQPVAITVKELGIRGWLKGET
jgi:hypothetical protein